MISYFIVLQPSLSEMDKMIISSHIENYMERFRNVKENSHHENLGMESTLIDEQQQIRIFPFSGDQPGRDDLNLRGRAVG